MALTQEAQVKQLIEGAKHILIIFGNPGKGDPIASASALASFLQKQKKQVEIVSDAIIVPKKFLFLPETNTIFPTIPHLQKFIITLDIQDAGIEELSYDVKDQQLHIFVTPKTGFLTQEHVKTAQSEFRYDLIITLSSPDLDSLGAAYKKNSDLFYQVPIINIDHKADNEQYGQINIVNTTASSTAEVVANLLFELEKNAVTKDIATALLTGMIAATNSFKTAHIRPHSLHMASTLVDRGAERQRIIQELYQTKSLATLRLWGQALAHLNYQKELGLISSTITREDFARSGAGEQELYDIIDELIATSPDEKMTLLLHEHPHHEGETIHGILYTEKEYDSKKLAAAFSPTGDARQVSFIITGKNLKEAEEMVIEEIKKKVL